MKIPVAVSGPLYLVAIIPYAAVGIVAIRTLASSKTEKMPKKYCAKDLLVTLLDMLGRGKDYSSSYSGQSVR